jgi:NADPH:quinone reductase-like Zn-dependent oxidoreductase
MKAIVQNGYGSPDVLALKDVATPGIKDDQVLVRVHAVSINAGDYFTMRGSPWLVRFSTGFPKPKDYILGWDMAGRVEAVGGGMTALRCLEQGRIQPGQRVLIYGASGAVGTNAVQIASRHLGAEVTGVCSAANLELVRSLGAVRVIDYTHDDFTRDGPIYDLVFDAVAKVAPSRAKKALKNTGIYLNAHKHSDAPAKARGAALLAVKELIEAGKLRPVVDRVYPLEQIVEAHRYVDQGHKRGNVVITVGQTGLNTQEKPS